MKQKRLFALLDWRFRKFTRPNDCILYRDEYEKLDASPVCDAKRYKIRQNDPGDVDGEPAKKNVHAKVMWYFPIIP